MPKLLCPHCLQPLDGGYRGECPHCGRSLENRNPEGALPLGTQLGGRYTVGTYLSADGDGLVAQMFEREVGEVEVDPFHQQVGRDERRLAARSGDHGRVVAYAPLGRPVAGGECAGEFVDKAEFPQFGDLRPFVLFHASDRILHKSSENFAVSQLRSPRSVRRSRSAVIPREDRTSVQRPCRRFSEGKGRRRTVRRGRDIIIFKELCRFREK